MLSNDLITRFEGCDWGESSPEEVKANEEALKLGSHVTATYQLADGKRLSVGTHGHQGVVVMHLVDEY